jgi:WD40 repeat protein
LRFGPGTGAVFAPDSKLTAIPTSTGLRLLDTASGREIATLEDPNLDSINQVLFAPDGTQLITINVDKGIHVWDLRLIRRELKELGLDWHWPEFPPATAARPLVQPVSVEIRGVDEESPNTL